MSLKEIESRVLEWAENNMEPDGECEIYEISESEEDYRVVVYANQNINLILAIFLAFGMLGMDLLGIDYDNEFGQYGVLYVDESYNIIEMGIGETEQEADSRRSEFRSSKNEASSDTSHNLADVTQTLGDVNSGDYLRTPKCPKCSSQRVGQEGDHSYQCRKCGHIFRTEEDVNIDLK